MKKDKNNNIEVEKFTDCLIDWATEIIVPGPSGEYILLHTLIRINNQIIALDPYTDDELSKLEEVVNKAITNERARRKSENTDSDV